jgi:hypothetical protein
VFVLYVLAQTFIYLKKEKIMTKKKVYVGKCIEVGVPRVWGMTEEECREAMKDYTDNHVLNKELQMFEYDGDDPYVALANPMGGKRV